MRHLQHDIVNKLYSIKGMIEAHLDRTEDSAWSRDLGERLKHAEWVLRRSYAQAERALTVTRRIGQAMKQEDAEKKGGVISALLARASVQKAWQNVEQELAREYPGHRVDILNRLPSDFPDICCSVEDLEEIFYHLGKNAFQAMGYEGRMIVRVEHSYSHAKGLYARITVADLGLGVMQGNMQYLFEPFFTTKHPKEGNGLGLYLTKILTSKNHGEIHVASVPGCGTTFSLEFVL